MSEGSLEEKAASILRADPLRLTCLEAVRALNLEDAWIAAGFVRNAIWDHCHGFTTPTPLNDVDVVYFNRADISETRDIALTQALHDFIPGVKWEVKNQARMHLKHNHEPYENTQDAIRRWVEIPTCVAASMDNADGIHFLAPFGLTHNFSLQVGINPQFPRPDVFWQRLEEKAWLRLWPALTLKTDNSRQ